MIVEAINGAIKVGHWNETIAVTVDTRDEYGGSEGLVFTPRQAEALAAVLLCAADVVWSKRDEKGRIKEKSHDR